MEFDLCRRFIPIWWTSNSIKEVGEKTGLSEYDVYIVAKNLRSLGVQLKKYRKGRRRTRMSMKETLRSKDKREELVRISQECADRYTQPVNG